MQINVFSNQLNLKSAAKSKGALLFSLLQPFIVTAPVTKQESVESAEASVERARPVATAAVRHRPQHGARAAPGPHRRVDGAGRGRRVSLVPLQSESHEQAPATAQAAYAPAASSPSGDLQGSATGYGHQAEGYLDMGAYSGGYGAFGWYADYPVGGGYH